MSCCQDLIEVTAFLSAGNSPCPSSLVAADFYLIGLGLILVLANLCVVTTGETCPDDYYINSTTGECVLCSVCEPGQGTEEPCGTNSDTVCKQCREGYHSQSGASGRECVECTECMPFRTEVSPCTSVRDAVCGGCSPGYFLSVDGGWSECLQCSKCPPDGSVVHWSDCAVAGLPVDQRCAPDAWIEPNTNTTDHTVHKPTASSDSSMTTEKTRLPTNHGMFVPMATYPSKPNLTPQDTTERTIAIVSLVFTAATTFAFLLSMSCLFREQLHSLPKKCRRNKKRISHTIKFRKAHYPVQEQGTNAIEETSYPESSIT